MPNCLDFADYAYGLDSLVPEIHTKELGGQEANKTNPFLLLNKLG